jgi:hypothetical protein
MSLAKRTAQIKTLASIASLLYVTWSLVVSPSVRAALRLHFSPAKNPVRFAAIAVALYLNAKSIPLIWHMRFFRGFLEQVYLRRAPLPRDALFRPMVTSGLYTPTNETDYNGHKSNSTYFADLDVSRTQHVACLLSHGIRMSNAGTHPRLDIKSERVGVAVDGAPANDSTGVKHRQGKAKEPAYNIALGAVSCHFKREIKPYQRFDIYTRLLCWDEKWLYQVSHLVKPGVVQPDHYSMQSWRTGRKDSRSVCTSPNSLSDEEGAMFKDAIFATSISKYVVKRGRQTVPPELVLQTNTLLPPGPSEPPNENSRKAMSGMGDAALWTWEAVEAERVRGMKLAEHFAALDGIQDEFPASQFASANGLEVLGEFKDLYL